MSEVLDRSGLAAGLETAGVAWRELTDAERLTYAIDGVQPSAICWPTTYREVAQALAVADRLGLAVAPRGAGTKVGLGNPPRRCDLIVSTERLARIVDYAPANLTVTVEAGLPLAALQATLAKGGQILPLDVPHADRATIGGIIATNASGPRRFGLGSARDLVIGTAAATTAGTVVRAGGRVVKNVAGYDLNKLYVGSLGTLVIVVEASFKVAPRPVARTTVIGRFARLEDLCQAAWQIARSPLMPTAVDLLDASAAAELSLAGLPDPRRGYLLATLGTAPGRASIRQRDALQQIDRQAGASEIVDLADDRSDAFWAQVAERPARAEGPELLRAKIAVPIGRLAAMIRAIEEREIPGTKRRSIGGRAASGVLSVHWQLASPSPDPASLAATAAALRELRETSQRLGGSLVVEWCPRDLKDHLDVWGDVGPALGLMRRLKAALDPNGTLNPGRFVGGI